MCDCNIQPSVIFTPIAATSHGNLPLSPKHNLDTFNFDMKRLKNQQKQEYKQYPVCVPDTLRKSQK
jgi:hypothetical protein